MGIPYWTVFQPDPSGAAWQDKLFNKLKKASQSGFPDFNQIIRQLLLLHILTILFTAFFVIWTEEK